MIALLPLRGWMGDAMATQMAAHAASQAVAKVAETGQEAASAASTADGSQDMAASATQAHHAAASADIDMPPDCISHGMQASDDERGSSDNTDGCANCTVCQACHTVALTVTGPTTGAAVQVAVPLSTYAAQFASAEPVTGQKPPIS
jgi:hypothetical protein